MELDPNDAESVWRDGDMVYTSVAQVFSSEIEPFALRGTTVPHDQRRARQPYLTENQAGVLMDEVLDTYQHLTGVLPSRVVVHKTSLYQPEEEKRFRRSIEARVSGCDLVWMRSTAFRLIRRGTQEPWRSTLCTIGDERYLFTSGYVPWWDEYPGPHIPSRLQIGACGPTNIRDRAKEILVDKNELELKRDARISCFVNIFFGSVFRGTTGTTL